MRGSVAVSAALYGAGVSDNDAARIAALRSTIEGHSRAYYDQDEPTIPDAAWDALLRELRDLEANHPELVTPDSPTQTVGAAASTTFAPVAPLLLRFKAVATMIGIGSTRVIFVPRARMQVG